MKSRLRPSHSSLSRRTVFKGAGAAAFASASGASFNRSVRAAGHEGHSANSGAKPNIIVVVLDDVGFADLGCYGSEIDTPAMDGLAARGLSYTNFHVTALCAPTRASLLTGRNAHAVDVGTIAEFGTDRPGYRGYIRPDVPTAADLLRKEGYGTYAVGKWHLSPVLDVNGWGPFDHWPTSRGFDKWYGFHGPLADHWHPELFENTVASYPDKSDGYHLSEDLTDRAIDYLRDHQTGRDQPFFLYLAYGACHWPLHVSEDYIARYRGRYDQGWDDIRIARHRRQVDEGTIPAATPLSPRNPGVPAWGDLTAREQAFAARTQEVYAAFLEHTDAQIGRLLASLPKDAEENTLILVMSDNGASREGSRIGMSDVRRNHYIERETPEDLFSALELLGSEHTFTAYPQGWAQASNTPLKWYKSKTYGGGVRAPLIMSWPGALGEGQRRGQWHHVTDILPTLLDVAGAPPDPSSDGISLAYTFASADTPTKKQIQHFETQGDRALWEKGWKAVAKHEQGTPLEDDPWELFHTDQDFAELTDLSAAEPERLADLKDKWFEEAALNQVLPQDDRTTENFANQVAPPKPSYVFYPGMTRVDRLSTPNIDAFSHRIEAEFMLQKAAESGVILAAGTALAGYELVLHEGVLTYVYAFSRSQHFVARADHALGPGQHSISAEFQLTGSLNGVVTLWVDGRKSAEVRVPRMWRLYATAAGVRCGENPTAPISRLYQGSGRFPGTLQPVRLILDV